MISLPHDFYIKAEQYGYSLCRGPIRYKKRDGMEVANHKIIGYYSGVASALKRYREELIHDMVLDERTALSQALSRISDIDKDIEKIFKELEEGKHE